MAGTPPRWAYRTRDPAGKIALPHEVDHPLHGFPLVDGIGHHPFQAGGEADRLVRLRRGHAVVGIGVVLEQNKIVVGDGAAQCHEIRRVLGDIHDLGAGLCRSPRRVDSDDSVGAPILGEADEHAGVGRAGDGADHDVIECDTELLLLCPHLFSEADIAQTAELVNRSAGRDGIGVPSLRLHVFDGPHPALTNADVKAVADQFNLCSHYAAHQDVPDPVVDSVFERHPTLLDQAAFHAELGGDRRDLPRVVGLHAADRDERIGVRCDGVRDDVFELADLVAA